MADMKLAGLNPMLAYKQGGASSPTGSMAPMPNFGAGISQGMQAGAGVVQATSAASLRKQQESVAASQTSLNIANALVAKENAMLTSARQKGESMRNFELYANLPKYEELWKFNQSAAGRQFNLLQNRVGTGPAAAISVMDRIRDRYKPDFETPNAASAWDKFKANNPPSSLRPSRNREEYRRRHGGKLPSWMR